MTTVPNGAPPRYAWYGRVSTEDEQDPTLSFPGSSNPSPRLVSPVATGDAGTSSITRSTTTGWCPRQESNLRHPV